MKQLSQKNCGNVITLLADRELGFFKGASNLSFLKIAEEKAATSEMQETHCQIPSSVRSTFLMSFSFDCSKVASTHGDHKIYVCSVRTGQLLHTLQCHPRTPWCLEFHPTSNDIVASGCLGGEVRVWHLHGGSEVWIAPNASVITSLTFHPFDKVLVIATQNELHFWNWSEPVPFAVCKTKCNKEKVRFVKFNSLGNKLITGISNVNASTRESSFTSSPTHPIQNFSRLSSSRDSRSAAIVIARNRASRKMHSSVTRSLSIVNASVLQSTTSHSIGAANFSAAEKPTTTEAKLDSFDQSSGTAKAFSMKSSLVASAFQTKVDVFDQPTSATKEHLPSSRSSPFQSFALATGSSSFKSSSATKSSSSQASSTTQSSAFQASTSDFQSASIFHSSASNILSSSTIDSLKLQPAASATQSSSTSSALQSSSTTQLSAFQPSASDFHSASAFHSTVSNFQSSDSLKLQPAASATQSSSTSSSSTTDHNALVVSKVFVPNRKSFNFPTNRTTVLRRIMDVYRQIEEKDMCCRGHPILSSMDAQPETTSASRCAEEVEEGKDSGIELKSSHPSSSTETRSIDSSEDSDDNETASLSHLRILCRSLLDIINICRSRLKPEQRIAIEGSVAFQATSELSSISESAPTMHFVRDVLSRLLDCLKISTSPGLHEQISQIFRKLTQIFRCLSSLSGCRPKSLPWKKFRGRNVRGQEESYYTSCLSHCIRLTGAILDLAADASPPPPLALLHRELPPPGLRLGSREDFTHRIQLWDFSKCDLPDLKRVSHNVVVKRCKIHNDASVAISKDGSLLVAFVPYRSSGVERLVFGVYSLRLESLGRCLCTWGFDSNAISVSLSPLGQYVVVGLPSPRPYASIPEEEAVAQIFRLKPIGSYYGAVHIRSLTQLLDHEHRSPQVSLNSVQWLPQPGQGLIYGTNRGCLCICKPRAPVTLKKSRSSALSLGVGGRTHTRRQGRG